MPANYSVSVVLSAVDHVSAEVKAIFDRTKTSIDGLQGSFQKTGRELNRIGTISLGAGLALGGALGMAAKSFGDFEQRMSNVGTLVDTNKESMSAMSDQVLAIGQRVPVALGDLADSLYQVRSAGIDGAHAMNVLEESSRLSVAGLSTAKEATDLMTSAINAFKSENLSAHDISNLFFETVKAGKTKINELSEAFGSVAPIVNAAGVKLRDFQAATAAMTVVGLPAANAQNAIRAALMSLEKPSKEMKVLFHDLGVTTGVQLLKTSGNLGNTFVRLSQAAEKSHIQLAKAMGRVEGLKTATILAGSENEKYNQTLKDMGTTTDEVGGAFDKQSKTFNTAMGLMKNKIMALGISVGQDLAPAITKGAKALGKMIDGFNGLPKPMKKFISLGAAVGTVGLVGFGAVAISIGQILQGLAAFPAACEIATTAMAGIKLEILALGITADVAFPWLAVLSGAAAVIIMNWKPIKGMFKDLFDGIGDYASYALDRIKPIIDPVGHWLHDSLSKIGVISEDKGYNAFAHSDNPFEHHFNSDPLNLHHHAAHRAMGGPIASGQPYWVGENGPELVVPRHNGRVIPNHKIASGGGGNDRIDLHLKIDASGRPSIAGFKHSGRRASLSLDMGLMTA